IVSAIEEGEVPLEQSIDKYAEGVELVKQCRQILDRAEKKIQLLGRGEGGQLEVTGELDELPDDAAGA
ncbi:MAG: exodeoxyribonuclease VII small subunit, partial [candidate division NC10 bacterium]